MFRRATRSSRPTTGRGRYIDYFVPVKSVLIYKQEVDRLMELSDHYPVRASLSCSHLTTCETPLVYGRTALRCRIDPRRRYRRMTDSLSALPREQRCWPNGWKTLSTLSRSSTMFSEPNENVPSGCTLAIHIMPCRYEDDTSGTTGSLIMTGRSTSG